MDRDPEGRHVMSLRLSRVLSDIGVTKQMVARRRRSFLVFEGILNAVDTISNKRYCDTFVFGSQSEGTTTLDMNSDLDGLQSIKVCRVILDWADWDPEKLCFLLLKNEHTPPQHCRLQVLKYDCPMPATLDMLPALMDVEKDVDNRVLLKNTWMDGAIQLLLGRQLIKRGPSRSGHKSIDIIIAFRYSGLLFECNFLFTRPKPGHWPRSEILTKARQSDTFLVPQGHAESDQSELEWRFGTPLIERLLMFDLNILQIQVYTFIKILRITFFKPLVGDRLSTFHFKTALLFTLEAYPPEIWQERNLMQCVIYCLKTLRRWFKLRHCPHYTISGVDLFVGKLRRWEFPLLLAVLSDMIDNIMDFVSQIQMEQIGERIVDRPRTVSTRYQNTLATVRICFGSDMLKIFGIYFMSTTGENNIFKTRDIIIKVREIIFESDILAVLQHAEKWLYQYLASMAASTCLQRNQPISPDIYRLYEASLDSDLTSSRLKLASMMYCSGQYEKAKLVLAYTERLLHTDVLQWCACPGRSTKFAPTERFLQKAYELPVSEVIKRHVACSVVFNSLEICCVPGFLVYEMHRTISPEDFQHRNSIIDKWMDLVVIDSKLFMFYLQYLTFRQLGEEERRLGALHKLKNYLRVEHRGCVHIETALNVVGHCYELENRYDMALAWYRISLRYFPYNNAARLHIMRLLQQA
ncbi:uncharacterized protein LOC128224519 [Mya arenaria]|uniref:uncharacterized protein LOC128224519 n=1 Tax=Mya arenaria TaxID=6604 RepID=UPI0022E2FD72|nr:uncharacterized protein LOC128224519 [Mya arenaria]XP_052790349.1 uncharacterized protein LOC128224519 [Mya arenaria]